MASETGNTPSDSKVKKSPPVPDVLASMGLLIGIGLVYGFTDLGIWPGRCKYVLGAACLLLSCGLTAWTLWNEFRREPITYWGGGTALLVTAVPLYLAVKSNTQPPCHVSTAKWVVLVLGLVGGASLLYGIFYHIENYQSVEKEGDQSIAVQPLTGREMRNLALVIVLSLALIVIARKLIFLCWTDSQIHDAGSYTVSAMMPNTPS